MAERAWGQAAGPEQSTCVVVADAMGTATPQLLIRWACIWMLHRPPPTLLFLPTLPWAQNGVDESIPTPSNLPWFDLLAHPAA